MGPWIPAQYPMGEFSCPTGTGGATPSYHWDIGGPWNGGGPVVALVDVGGASGLNDWAVLGLAVVAGVLIGGMARGGKRAS